MKSRLQELNPHQTVAALTAWRNAVFPARPATGWSRAIRDALGMTARALAARLGMTSAGVHKLEQAEADDAITLASLRKLAEALDCELRYALVPRTSLRQYLNDRAQTVARERLRPVSHSMSLEDQAVRGVAGELQRDLLAQELLRGPRRELW